MRRLATPRWLLVHALVVVTAVTFLLLGWWQVSRARAGNPLSFGYALEWPAFAAFGVYVWIKELRRVLRTPPAGTSAEPANSHHGHGQNLRGVSGEGQTSPRPRSDFGPAYDDSDDPELAAYNKYLAWRAANPDASMADYPY